MAVQGGQYSKPICEYEELIPCLLNANILNILLKLIAACTGVHLIRSSCNMRMEKYLANRWKGMLGSLSVLSASADPEAVHALRLHAKRIKTMAVLAGVHKRPYWTPFKALIRQAGEIRTAELNLQILKDHSYSNPVLELKLGVCIQNGYRTLRKDHATHRSAILSAVRGWKEEQHLVDDDKLLFFIRMLVSELKAAFRWQVRERDLHENRKKIKQLLYSYRFLPKKLQGQPGIDPVYLDRLQEQVGEWHDLEMVLLFLKEKRLQHAFIYTRIKKEQEEVFETIRREARLFQNRMQRRISANAFRA